MGPRRVWSGTNHLTYSDRRVLPGGDEVSVVHLCPTLLPPFMSLALRSGNLAIDVRQILLSSGLVPLLRP